MKRHRRAIQAIYFGFIHRTIPTKTQSSEVARNDTFVSVCAVLPILSHIESDDHGCPLLLLKRSRSKRGESTFRPGSSPQSSFTLADELNGSPSLAACFYPEHEQAAFSRLEPKRNQDSEKYPSASHRPAGIRFRQRSLLLYQLWQCPNLAERVSRYDMRRLKCHFEE
jgi:hypothetical protein